MHSKLRKKGRSINRRSVTYGEKTLSIPGAFSRCILRYGSSRRGAESRTQWYGLSRHGRYGAVGCGGDGQEGQLRNSPDAGRFRGFRGWDSATDSHLRRRERAPTKITGL